MKMDDILNLIRQLACSQGMYGRFYRDLMDVKECNIDAYEGIKEELESQNFKDALDFILWFEGGE